MVNSEENVHVNADLLYDDKVLTFAVIPAHGFCLLIFTCNLLNKRSENTNYHLSNCATQA